MNAGRMADALAGFAGWADPRGEKVLVDNAGWHMAKRLAVPGNMVLHFLPSCTPELQPVELLWLLVREAVANRPLGRLDRRRNVLRARLGHLARNPELVRRVIGFHWTRRLER